MSTSTSTLPRTKRIALIAHDNRKVDLLEWARFNRDILAQHQLFGTGTTGGRIQRELGLEVHRFQSGPLGGDQQVGAKIAEGGIDMVIFFWDPLQPLPHDVDVKALLRLAVVYNIPTACNRATADFLISSPLMESPYDRRLVDYESKVGSNGSPRPDETEHQPTEQVAAGFTVAETPSLDPEAKVEPNTDTQLTGVWGIADPDSKAERWFVERM